MLSQKSLQNCKYEESHNHRKCFAHLEQIKASELKALLVKLFIVLHLHDKEKFQFLISFLKREDKNSFIFRPFHHLVEIAVYKVPRMVWIPALTVLVNALPCWSNCQWYWIVPPTITTL